MPIPLRSIGHIIARGSSVLDFKKQQRQLKKTWLGSNRHYLLPLIAVLVLLNSALALWGLIAMFFFSLLKVLRAKLPLDPGGKSEPLTVVYKDREDMPPLKMDLWHPSGETDLKATVFFAHGGGWISGMRNQPNNVSWCRYLSSRGFTVASIDYRLAYRYGMEDILEDYTDALNYLREHYRDLDIPGDKIILMGLSAGGHLALGYGAYHTSKENHKALESIAGVVSYYAPSELLDLFSDDDKSLFVRFGTISAMKGPPRKNQENYKLYSPLTWITERMVPVLVVHGRLDEIVPYDSSVKLVRKLKNLGVTCRFLVHKRGEHGFETRRKDYRTALILEETVRFMKNLV